VNPDDPIFLWITIAYCCVFWLFFGVGMTYKILAIGFLAIVAAHPLPTPEAQWALLAIHGTTLWAVMTFGDIHRDWQEALLVSLVTMHVMCLMAWSADNHYLIDRWYPAVMALITMQAIGGFYELVGKIGGALVRLRKRGGGNGSRNISSEGVHS
jgi:hypothetical protein